MPSRRVCTVPGCPRFTSGGRCEQCERQADRDRGTAAERGYTSAGHRRFRAAVLDKDPICVVCDLAAATVADHYPLSRRELIIEHRDPDDPKYGRGLCARCHNRSTATTPGQEGGWNRR